MIVAVIAGIVASAFALGTYLIFVRPAVRIEKAFAEYQARREATARAIIMFENESR